jgi:hypothetical protein
MHAREPHDYCCVRADSHILQGAYDGPVVGVCPQVANRCLRIGWPPQSGQAGPNGFRRVILVIQRHSDRAV